MTNPDYTVTLDAGILTSIASGYAERVGYDPSPGQLSTLERVHDLLHDVDPALAVEVASHSSALTRTRLGGEPVAPRSLAILKVAYDEDTASDRTQIVDHPDGSRFHVTPEWICDQIDDGVFVLGSTISADVIRARLG